MAKSMSSKAKGIIGTAVVLLLGVSVLPSVAQSVSDAQANVSGAAAYALPVITLMFTFALIMFALSSMDI